MNENEFIAQASVVHHETVIYISSCYRARINNCTSIVDSSIEYSRPSSSDTLDDGSRLNVTRVIALARTPPPTKALIRYYYRIIWSRTRPLLSRERERLTYFPLKWYAPGVRSRNPGHSIAVEAHPRGDETVANERSTAECRGIGEKVARAVPHRP